METPTKRPYRKQRRAEQEAATREAIAAAAVELHRSLGPARTTLTEVAVRAGVSRMTVYKHFPTDAELFAACSSHWAERHPFPDPERWAAVAEPGARLARALPELYAWYRTNADMLGAALRDAPLLPALAELMEARWWTFLDRVVAVLTAGRRATGARRRELRAALALAVDFQTWRTLSRAGLTDREAARLAARAVAAAVAPAPAEA